MKLRVLYFAALRERLGRSEESLDAPNDVTQHCAAKGLAGAAR